MSENLSYCVFPKEISHQTVNLTESEKAKVEGLSVDYKAITFVAIGCLTIFIGYTSGLAAIAGVFAIISITCFLVIDAYQRNQNIAALKQKKTEEAIQRETNRVTKDADYITSAVTSNYQSSKKLSREVSNCLKEASLWLRTAENEYKANAFAPFWDAIEQSAIWLGTYNYKVKQIAKNADEYYRKLNGVKHDFPDFPITPESLSDTSFVINELYRITRLGQTNFHFANIWEHRRTRKEIVSGFRNLNEAINNLGDTIQYSISNLQDSISSDIANVVQEQIKTRESIDRTRQSVDKTRESVDKTGTSIDKRLLEQNRMLDNIQHDREPKLRDIPSKH